MGHQRADHDEHEGLGVSAERILQEVCQLSQFIHVSFILLCTIISMRMSYLAIPVGNMTALLALTQGTDDIAKTAQTAIDILGLLEAVAGRTAMSQTLAPGQIDEVEGTLGALAGDAVLAAESKNKDGVAARGALVGLCGGDAAVGGGAPW